MDALRAGFTVRNLASGRWAIGMDCSAQWRARNGGGLTRPCHKRGVWNTLTCGTLSRCGSCSINLYSRHGLDLWLHPHQPPAPGGGPGHVASQVQLLGGDVPGTNIHRDVGVSGTTGTQGRQGWHQLDGRLAGGDTLVVVAIDRIGRTWQDTIRSICSLRDRGVKVRSLADAEKEWTRHLEADDGSPEAFFGQVLTMFAAWVADQELESVRRRTREGLERSPPAGEDAGAAAEAETQAGGGDPWDAGRRRQPPADRQRLRVLCQHGSGGVAAGRSGVMNVISTPVLQSWLAW